MGRTIKLKNNNFFDDDALVEQIFSGNSEAEGPLYQKYNKKLLNGIKNKVINISDAEDIVQDTMIVAIVNIRNGKYVHNQTLYSYLTGIRRILLYTFYKNKKYYSPINNDVNIIDINIQPDSIEIINKKRINYIIQAIKDLDEKCKKLLKYSIFDGFKPEHIVKLMPELETPDKVYKRRFKCKEKIKRKIKKLMQHE